MAPFNGPVERRGNSLISIDRELLEERIKAYFDTKVPDSEVARYHASLMMTGNRIVGPEARIKLLKEHAYSSTHIVKYPFKVFDVRWGYLANIRPLFSEPSPHLLKQRFTGNAFFITRDTADKSPEGPPFYYSRLVCDYDTISGHARHFPILLKNGSRLERKAERTLFAALGDSPEKDETVANMSRQARDYLQSLKCKNLDHTNTAGLIWMHALAIGYSPAYLNENADGIRRDWPRIPLPDSRKALETSAALGERIAALLDTETGVPGVTTGKIDPALNIIGRTTKVGDGTIDPSGDDLAVDAGWGHFGKDNAVMPGKGKIAPRDFDPKEMDTIPPGARELLGPNTTDVYMNRSVYWRNVPAGVWNYHIGGYQVLKKWLSYREKNILGRALKPEEAREVTAIARRLAALILLQPKLDENYRAIKAAAFDWSSLR